MDSIIINTDTPTWRDTLTTYRDLMKFRIVILLVFTTVTGMVVAADGVPDAQILVATIIAGIFAAGGSSAMNQYIDRDLDAKMKRTCKRPIPSGRIEPMQALLFGLILVILSVVILAVFVNLLAAMLAFVGAMYYVGLYTLVLKRNTVVNIVIGGGAGAIPVLVGWAAVRGSLSVEALLLFAVVFFWTPPHSWALAILVSRDYAAAGVPMMPVARGEDSTRIQILIYSVILVLITLLPGVALFVSDVEFLGNFYLVSAVVLGIGQMYMSIMLLRVPTKAMARTVYKYTSTYLALLFLSMIIDRFV